MTTPTTIVIISPFSYQPFYSIRLLCQLLSRELSAEGMEVINLAPDSFLGDMTKNMKDIHRFVAGFERLTLSPMLLRSKLIKLERKARQLKRDFVVVVSDQSLGCMAGALSGFRVLTFVSDLISLKKAMGEFGDSQGFFQRFNQHAALSGLRSSSAYITPSRSTADDLARYILSAASCTTVVALPLPAPMSPLPAEELSVRLSSVWRQKKTLPRAYILMVGSAAWYKNRPGVIHILAYLKKLTPTPPALVFVGEAPNAIELSLIQKTGIEFYHFAETSADDLNTLYCGAECLMMPSFAEGFGWPALEALAAGTPLIITDTSSLGEYFTDAAAIVFSTPLPSEIEAWVPVAAEEVLKFLQLNSDDRAVITKKGIARAATFTPERFHQGLIQAVASTTN